MSNNKEENLKKILSIAIPAMVICLATAAFLSYFYVKIQTVCMNLFLRSVLPAIFWILIFIAVSASFFETWLFMKINEIDFEDYGTDFKNKLIYILWILMITIGGMGIFTACLSV